MNRFYKACAALGLLFSLTLSAHAAPGFGFFIEHSAASGKANIDNDGFVDSHDFDFDSGSFRFGFAMDTSVDNARLFNYRLNIGVESTVLDIKNFSPASVIGSYSSARYSDSAFSTEFDLVGISVSHDFGFALYRNAKVRLWAGPSLYTSLSAGEIAKKYPGYEGFGDSIALFGFGLGPTLGVNINFSRHLALAIKGGVRFVGHAGLIKHKDHPANVPDDEDTLIMLSNEPFINLSLLF